MGDNNKAGHEKYNFAEIMGVFPDYKISETNNIDLLSSSNIYEKRVNNYFNKIKGECILEYIRLRSAFKPAKILKDSLVPEKYHSTLIKKINSYLAIE